MAMYATADDLAAAVADTRGGSRRMPRGADAVERLLERGERAVDLIVGPWPRDPASGLKFDPATATLTDVQRGAVRDATVAYCVWELVVGYDFVIGGADFAPSTLVLAQRAANDSPEMARVLADHGLVKRALCAAPEPERALCPPDGGWVMTP